jgi:hypothetical protein
MSRTFGEIRQVAFVLRDLERGLRYWTETLGVGPFYVLRDLVPESYRYRGEVVPAPRVSIALGFSGDVQIELIEQHDDRQSAYRDFLASGREGFQHVSSWFTRPEYDPMRSRLLDKGFAIVHEGAIPGSGIRFAYFATETSPGGLVFEISEGRDPAIYPLIEKILVEARSWDGERPVRDFAELVR